MKSIIILTQLVLLFTENMSIINDIVDRSLILPLLKKITHSMFNSKYCPVKYRCNTLLSVHYVLHTTFCTLLSVHYVLHTTFCTLRSVHYVMYTTLCTLRSAHCVPHTAFRTLRSVKYVNVKWNFNARVHFSLS